MSADAKLDEARLRMQQRASRTDAPPATLAPSAIAILDREQPRHEWFDVVHEGRRFELAVNPWQTLDAVRGMYPGGDVRPRKTA